MAEAPQKGGKVLEFVHPDMAPRDVDALRIKNEGPVVDIQHQNRLKILETKREVILREIRRIKDAISETLKDIEAKRRLISSSKKLILDQTNSIELMEGLAHTSHAIQLAKAQIKTAQDIIKSINKALDGLEITSEQNQIELRDAEERLSIVNEEIKQLKAISESA